MSALGPKEKQAYIWARTKGVIQSAISRCNSKIGKIIREIVCKFCLELGFSLPASMRSFYILGIYRGALQLYTRKPYEGQAILVRAENRPVNYANDWSRLITGGVALYEVVGDHMMIRQESYARPWAGILRACLTKAQAKCTAVQNQKGDHSQFAGAHSISTGSAE
jgi:hypothetical protein